MELEATANLKAPLPDVGVEKAAQIEQVEVAAAGLAGCLDDDDTTSDK